MTKKIYISGQITGLDYKVAKELFSKAEYELKSMGFIPVNPMTIKHDHDETWLSYMKQDIKALMDCDGIYLLSNWMFSKGATIERDLAYKLGLLVLNQKS